MKIDLLAKICGPASAGAIVARWPTYAALAGATELQLRETPGVGPATAAALRAAVSIAYDMPGEAAAERPLLDTPDRIAALVMPLALGASTETMWVACLDTRRRLIELTATSQGTLDTLMIRPAQIFRAAIAANSAAIVVVHNHPSGDPTPSEADICITRDLVRGGKVLKIELLDHVIIGTATIERPRAWCSLRELGYFYT